METCIDSKHFKTFCIPELCSYLSATDEKPLNKGIVVRCSSLLQVKELWRQRDFREIIEGDKTCFVIVFEVEEDLHELRDAFVNETFTTAKPMIVSFESLMNIKSNAMIYKDFNKNSFKKVDQAEGFKDDEIDFETLLEAFRSGAAGHYNGKLLSTSLDISNVTGMNLVEQAVGSNNILCMKFLRLFDSGKDLIETKTILEIAAKSCDYQGFLALLDLPFDCEMYDFMRAIDSLEVLHPHHPESINLLMIASESGNAEAVNFLLKCSYDVNQHQNLNETAASLAWEKENYDIFVHLLKENSLFPQDFHQKLKNQRARGKVRNVLTFISDVTSFHEAIKRGRIEHVKTYLVNNPNTRHAYNIRNQSAASTALEAEQFGIYELLISQGVCLGPHEDVSEILSRQEQTNFRDNRKAMMKKIYIHEMHKKYFKVKSEQTHRFVMTFIVSILGSLRQALDDTLVVLRCRV